MILIGVNLPLIFPLIFNKFRIVLGRSMVLTKAFDTLGLVNPGTFQIRGMFNTPLKGHGPLKRSPWSPIRSP